MSKTGNIPSSTNPLSSTPSAPPNDGNKQTQNSGQKLIITLNNGQRYDAQTSKALIQSRNKSNDSSNLSSAHNNKLIPEIPKTKKSKTEPNEISKFVRSVDDNSFIMLNKDFNEKRKMKSLLLKNEINESLENQIPAYNARTKGNDSNSNIQKYSSTNFSMLNQKVRTKDKDRLVVFNVDYSRTQETAILKKQGLLTRAQETEVDRLEDCKALRSMTKFTPKAGRSYKSNMIRTAARRQFATPVHNKLAKHLGIENECRNLARAIFEVAKKIANEEGVLDSDISEVHRWAAAASKKSLLESNRHIAPRHRMKAQCLNKSLAELEKCTRIDGY